MAAQILVLPDKPSIAVLPFQNMSGYPEQEYFTDGVTEDVITELSRFHSLFVIARNSSFSYKGKFARHSPGRQGTPRRVCAGRQHPQSVGSDSCDRPAHRHIDRQPHLGGTL
jgi:TolB-like protein